MNLYNDWNNWSEVIIAMERQENIQTYVVMEIMHYHFINVGRMCWIMKHLDQVEYSEK